MASKRLTQVIKHEIVNNVIRDVFPPRREALGKQYRDIAVMIYRDFVATPDDAKLISGLPGTWFPQGKTVCATINGCAYRGELPESGPLPYRISGVRDHSDRYHYKTGHPVADAFEAWQKAQNRCNADESELRRQTRTVLAGATTTKKLLEIWPEAEKYLPEDLNEPSTEVAVRCDKLNDMISELAEGRRDVVLVSCGYKKIPVIKEIRAFTRMGLKEAKGLADAAPVIIATGLLIRDAEKFKRQLESVGATVELR